MLTGEDATEDSCPSCGGTDLTYDGSCGGQLAKCMDCGAMIVPEPKPKSPPPAC